MWCCKNGTRHQDFDCVWVGWLWAGTKCRKLHPITNAQAPNDNRMDLDSLVSLRTFEGIGWYCSAKAPPSPSRPTTAGGGTLTVETWFAGRWPDSDGWPAEVPPSSCQHSDWEGSKRSKMSNNVVMTHSCGNISLLRSDHMQTLRLAACDKKWRPQRTRVRSCCCSANGGESHNETSQSRYSENPGYTSNPKFFQQWQQLQLNCERNLPEESWCDLDLWPF